ncbi:MAG: type restriction enzyme terminus family protein [Bacteroidetes bacterium]|jgi:predicted type IV restriction endonuclease|nr:type restriction enzyme terminus family protein [Bacteroidota bacterium]
MAAIPAKIQSRLSEGLKKFQPIVEGAKIRDINESDTVVILTGILSEIFGYDKYTDITTEMAIRGTYCDLALKVNNKVEILLEAKAAGIELKEQHVKQAVDYASNKGIDWVILTNGVNWKVYKILFTKPIQNILVCDINFLHLKHKSQDDLEILFLLSKEGVSKKSLEDFFTQKQATNRFMIGNILTCDSVISSIKKELKGIYPDIKVTNEEIHNVLMKEVIKREITEGEEAEEAKKKIIKALKKKEKAKTTSKLSDDASMAVEAIAIITDSETIEKR